MVAITLPDGSVRRYDRTVTGADVAADIGAGLAKAALAVRIDGEMRKVLMHADRNGFLYTLDRTNGKLIAGNPFVTVNWAERIDLATGRPVVGELALAPDPLMRPIVRAVDEWQGIDVG